MLTVLLMGVEVSDQYGTSDIYVVGVFDQIGDVAGAKAKAKALYPTRRVFFREVHTLVNTSDIKKV